VVEIYEAVNKDTTVVCVLKTGHSISPIHMETEASLLFKASVLNFRL